jgi:hypothetical protein
MSRTLIALVSSVLACLSAALRAQDLTKAQFRAEISRGVEVSDEKIIDKAMKRSAYHALNYYEELYDDKAAGKETGVKLCETLMASWKRCFESSDTMEQLDRWYSSATTTMREQLQKERTQSLRVWTHYTDDVAKGTNKADYEQVMQQFMELAKAAESIGHAFEVAECWNCASVVGNRMPDKSVANRHDALFATEQFLEARQRWNFTFDEHFLRSVEWVKAEKAKIEAAEKAGDKRKAEGYSAESKGIDTLVMPNVAEVKSPLKFEALAGWDELDYGDKGGPVPAFWWLASTTKEATSGKYTAGQLSWFQARKLWLHRTGASKFAIGFEEADDKSEMEIETSNKGKVTTLWLDPDKKHPYAMVFWTGTDREMVNEAECNLSPGDTVGNVYYRSATSWKTQIGADTVIYYDDDADGNPCGAAPFAREFRSGVLGDYDAEKPTLAPLFDSMRVGKGPRMPCSEFVKLSTGWAVVKKGKGDEVGMRPLNPEYVKTGKIKLVWNGPKPTAPVQLVVQGAGDFETALFDVAGGKEVEVPASEYRVIWGRMMIGKGPRAQVANIYQGTSKPFAVEAGKTYELKMGAPFSLVWNRRGDENAKIDALKILLAESTGCVFTELQGINLACDVLAAKEADGKGAKQVGKFLRFTDPELVNKAADKIRNVGLLCASFPMPEGYKSGEPILSLKLPAAGMKLSLSIKKHALFGELKSAWQ